MTPTLPELAASYDDAMARHDSVLLSRIYAPLFTGLMRAGAVTSATAIRAGDLHCWAAEFLGISRIVLVPAAAEVGSLAAADIARAYARSEN